MKAICASENFDLFIRFSVIGPEIQNWNFPASSGPVFGEQVSDLPKGTDLGLLPSHSFSCPPMLTFGRHTGPASAQVALLA
jgi:hypothetical protein